MENITYYLAKNNIIFAYNEKNHIMLVWYNYEWVKINYSLRTLLSFKVRKITMERCMVLNGGTSAAMAFNVFNMLEDGEINYSDNELEERKEFVTTVSKALKELDNLPNELKEPCKGKNGCSFRFDEMDCELCKKANAIYDKLNEPVVEDKSIEMFNLDCEVDEKIDSFFAGFNFENKDVYEVENGILNEAICPDGISFIPVGVQKIGEEVFLGSKIKEVVFSKDVVCIAEKAFENCHNLTKFILPNRIHTIGYKAFYGCDSIFELSLPYNLRRISAHSFERCRNLKTIYIPKTITSIDEQAFKGCNNLEKVVFLGSTDEWMMINKDGKIFENTKVLIISCLDDELM